MNNQKIHDYRYWERISTRLQLVEVRSHQLSGELSSLLQ